MINVRQRNVNRDPIYCDKMQFPTISQLLNVVNLLFMGCCGKRKRQKRFCFRFIYVELHLTLRLVSDANDFNVINLRSQKQVFDTISANNKYSGFSSDYAPVKADSRSVFTTLHDRA